MTTSLLRLAILGLLLGALAAPLAAQDTEAPSQKPGYPPVDAAGLALEYYTPERADPYELASMLAQLHHRRFYVVDDQGGSSGPVENISAFGRSVVLYDQRDHVLEMLTTATGLDNAWASEASDALALQVSEYVPRYLSANALSDALRPFKRQFALEPPTRRSNVTQVSNVTVLQQPEMIVMRDTAERVDEMLSLLERIDQPAPQVLLTCWLLRGSDEAHGDELPHDLTENLSQLVPFQGFDRLSVAMMRTSVIAGDSRRMKGDFLDSHWFQLDLRPAGYDPQEGVLSFTDLSFKTSLGQEFQTSAIVRDGEYTVLGGTGREPIFVVLRVTPIP